MTAVPGTGSADPRMADVVKAVNFVADAGKQMLESSSSVSEVIDRLIEVAPAVGLDSCDINATLSSVTISSSSQSGC